MKKEKLVDSPEGVQALLKELVLLRARIDDATAQFGLGMKAAIDEIHHALGRGDSPTSGHVLPEPRVVEKMVRRLRLLGARPVKGRAKDLKRIQDLVTSLSETVSSRE